MGIQWVLCVCMFIMPDVHTFYLVIKDLNCAFKLYGRKSNLSVNSLLRLQLAEYEFV